LELEKAVAGVCAEARKVFATKQKESPGKDATAYTAELQKMNARLNQVTQDLAKERKAALNAEKIYKVRQTVQDKGKEMDDIEAELEKVEIMTTPIGDERPSNEAIQEMDVAVTAVQTSLTECKKACDSAALSATGPHKEALQKLLERCKEAQEKLDEIKETTREQTERVLSEKILAEAQGKTDKIEEAFEKAEQAEAPYLKGLDVLPLEEAIQAVADSEAAIIVVQQLITEARTFFSSKSLELRRLLDAISKPALAKIAEITSKNEE
jgi:3-deoxy-D-manno-octulosonate 8-phosphate phosphatase KdsC-like HAD superfamily phosphatase